MAELADEDRMLAAEYALRLLGDDEHAAAAARARDDAAFATEVARWQEDLARLADELEPVAPSAAARRALMARVFGSPARRATRWIVGALASAALAVLVLYVAVGNDLLVPTNRPELTAELQAEGRDLLIAAAYDADTGALQLTRVAGDPAPAGRATELWAIAPESTPVSLGLVPDEPGWQLDLPADLQQQAAQLVLALSDEPAGGSPTGQPTGAVLAAVELQPVPANE